MAIIKIFVLILCISIVLPSTDCYLFKIGRITIRFYQNGQRKTQRYLQRNLDYIDQHKFDKVVDLKLQTKELPILYNGSVKSLPLLQQLRLTSCNIRKLSVKAFQNLPQLNGLHLNDNLLEEIDEGIFNDLVIKELFLQRNRIRIVREKAFDNMPNLQLIQLNNNKITVWNSNWFHNTPNLINVYFRRNRIEELPPYAFYNLQSNHLINNERLYDLKLFLSKNQIKTIHSETFKNLDGIDQLWLDRNKIKQINKDVFGHFVELNHLNLAKNQLVEIDKQLFPKLEEITILDVSHNRLLCLPYEIVRLTRTVYVDRNGMDCNCIKNLRERLLDENHDNIVNDNEEC